MPRERTRDVIWLNCQDGKHDWKFIGGANAGCGPNCSCSVPVHECACGDCDYGENQEAHEVRVMCARVRGENLPLSFVQ